MVARASLKGGRVKGGIVISGPEPFKIEPGASEIEPGGLQDAIF